MTKYINYAGMTIAVAGLILSGYLWWYQVVGAQYIPCTISGCADVLTSDFGKMFGIPVAVYGFFYYAVIAIFIFQKFFIKNWVLDYMLYAGVVWGLVYSLYLRYLEFFKIGDICAWCWLSVLFVVLLCAIYGYEWFVNYHQKK